MCKEKEKENDADAKHALRKNQRVCSECCLDD